MNAGIERSLAAIESMSAEHERFLAWMAVVLDGREFCADYEEVE
jgi:hypothetical protein